MDKIQEVLNEAIKLVEPSKEEEGIVQKATEKTLELIKKEIEKCKVKPQVVLGGSYAKGTWLKGEADIDVFMKFPLNLDKDDLERLAVKIGKTALKDYKPTLRYAEHPYVEAYVDGVRVNIVGCYDVHKGEWKSAADRSPYHTILIKDKFNDELRRETRLLKKFMKGIGIYGAEVAIQGFSGYVCEVLILKYGSFLSTIKEASNFKDRQIISLEKVDEELIKLHKSPLIILDPIDYRRNLGAAISPENVGKFILASRSFLTNPDIRYFTGVKIVKPLEELKASSLIKNLVAITFNHKPRSVDILWGQLRRSLVHLKRQMELNNFKVFRMACCSDNKRMSAFLYLLEEINLPNEVVKIGPKVFMSKDVERFLMKNQDAKILWIGDDLRIYGLVKRKYPLIRYFLNDLLSKNASSSGIAPGLISDIEQSFKIHIGDEVLKVAKNKSWLAEVAYGIICKDGFGLRIG